MDVWVALYNDYGPGSSASGVYSTIERAIAAHPEHTFAEQDGGTWLSQERGPDGVIGEISIERFKLDEADEA